MQTTRNTTITAVQSPAPAPYTGTYYHHLQQRRVQTATTTHHLDDDTTSLRYGYGQNTMPLPGPSPPTTTIQRLPHHPTTRWPPLMKAALPVGHWHYAGCYITTNDTNTTNPYPQNSPTTTTQSPPTTSISRPKSNLFSFVWYYSGM